MILHIIEKKMFETDSLEIDKKDIQSDEESSISRISISTESTVNDQKEAATLTIPNYRTGKICEPLSVIKYEEDKLTENLPEVMAKLKENTVISNRLLVKKLQTLFKKPIDENKSIFYLSKKRLLLLVDVGKFIDSLSKSNWFAKGFEMMFSEEIPNVHVRWVQASGGKITLVLVLENIRWIIVGITLCYHNYIMTRQRTNINFISKLEQFVENMTKTNMSANTLLSNILSFYKSLEFDGKRKHETVLKEAKADTMEVRQTAEAVIGHNGHCIISSNDMFIMSQKQKSKEATFATSDDESIAFSPMSSKRKKLKMEESINITDPDEMLHSFQRQDRNVFEKRNDLTASATCSKNQSKSLFPIPNNRSNPPNADFKNKQIIINPNVVDIIQFNNTYMNNMKPNAFIMAAFKKVVIHIIETSIENPSLIVTLGDVLKDLVKNITFAVFGRMNFDINKLISCLTNTTDPTHKEAVIICIKFITLLRCKDKSIVSVPWTVVNDWCCEFSKLIESVVAKTISKRIDQGNTTLVDLKNEFAELRKQIEIKFEQKYKYLIPLFLQLSKINDIFLYIVFGVNVSKNLTGQNLYTDFIVKTTLFAWHLMGTFPIDVSKGNDEKLNNIYWCLPIAFLTNLRGVGITPISEETTDIACSINEFWEEFDVKTYCHLNKRQPNHR